MIIVRQQTSEEPDLLTGLEYHNLTIRDLDGVTVATLGAPDYTGWTCDKLEEIDYNEYSPDGWDAYVGGQWIGSSEV